MKAFVTGTTGFLGSRLAENLLDRGADVRCLVRPTADVRKLNDLAAAHRPGQLTLHRGILGRLDASMLEGCDTIYHVAAALKGSTAVLFLNNVIATQQLIELAGKARIRRIVLVSSLGVYGSQPLPKGQTLDETCPLDPRPHLRDPYSYSKVMEELEARNAAKTSATSLVIIRPGVIYGPGRDCISGRVGLQFGPLLVRMGGNQPLPYTFVDNCADAIALAGQAEGVDGEAFNIVDDDPPTSRQLLRLYRKGVGKKRTLPLPQGLIQPISRMCESYNRRSKGQLPAILTPYKSAAMWKAHHYSNEKAKRLLGWRPRVSFDQGLRLTFTALRENLKTKR